MRGNSARRKFKHRSRTTRDPPARFYPLRATPSTRPQPPARTDPRPHATAFPPREHTAAAPRPASGRNFAPHRHSAASPSSAAAPSAAGGARHPDGSAPAAVSPSAASTRAIAAGSWIATTSPARVEQLASPPPRPDLGSGGPLDGSPSRGEPPSRGCRRPPPAEVIRLEFLSASGIWVTSRPKCLRTSVHPSGCRRRASANDGGSSGERRLSEQFLRKNSWVR